jgi:hypothetical protein
MTGIKKKKKKYRAAGGHRSASCRWLWTPPFRQDRHAHSDEHPTGRGSAAALCAFARGRGGRLQRHGSRGHAVRDASVQVDKRELLAGVLRRLLRGACCRVPRLRLPAGSRYKEGALPPQAFRHQPGARGDRHHVRYPAGRLAAGAGAISARPCPAACPFPPMPTAAPPTDTAAGTAQRGAEAAHLHVPAG